VFGFRNKDMFSIDQELLLRSRPTLLSQRIGRHKVTAIGLFS